MVLSKNGGYSRIIIAKHVHRLVAEAFIENNEPEKCWVDHIDGNRSNNNVENLRWVTPSENALSYGYWSRIENKKRPVKATHLDGTVIVFESRKDAADYFGCNDSQISYNRCYVKGNKKGWVFQKVEDIV